MRRYAKLATALVAGMMTMPSLAADVGSLSLYDDFNGKWVHPDKWEGGTGTANMETVWRLVDDGMFKTGLRGFSSITTKTGRQKHRNSLYLPEDMAVGVTTLAAEAMVDWGYVRGCKDAESDSRIRFRLGGYFFNAGGSAFCGDRTGDVWAQIWIRDKHNDKLGKDIYDVSANVWRCDDATCKSGTSMFFKRLGLISEDEMTKLAVRWVDAEDSFVFASSLGDTTYKYTDDMVNFGDVAGRTYAKGIQTTTDIQNCVVEDDVRPYGVIAAKVDNFYLNSDFKELNDAHPGRACDVPVCTTCAEREGEGEGGGSPEDEAARGFEFSDGFEYVYVKPAKWNVYDAPTTFGEWEVVSGSVDVHSNKVSGGVGDGGAGGLNHADLAGDHLGVMQRKIEGMVPGASYTLSYNYARHTCTTEAIAALTIGDLEHKWSAVNDGRDEWKSASHEFVAKHENETLFFQALGNQTSCGMLIDDISIVSALPAKSTDDVAAPAGRINNTNTQSSMPKLVKNKAKGKKVKSKKRKVRKNNSKRRVSKKRNNRRTKRN